MPALVVGGITIPVAPGGISRDRLDMVDRARAMDGTYRASATGNPKREWRFSTPPVARSLADFYEVVLGGVGAVTCSGDILGGSSNLLARSEELDVTAAWTVSAATITANAATAPDGTLTADAVLETTTTADHYVYQASTGTAGVRQAMSAFLHAGGRSWGALFVETGARGKAWFDLTNGVLGTVSGTGSPTSSILSVGSGWYRCTVTATLTGTGAFNAGIAIATADNISSYLGSAGTGILAWGAQLEVGSAATPYVRTGAAGVNTLSLSCFPEITGWHPVKLATGHAAVIDFALHQA